MDSLFTLEEMQELCKEWQKILRLEFWDIQLKVVRANEMSGGCSNLGSVSWNLGLARAVISILDPIDKVSSFPRDMELDLVHELLHLHFAPADKIEVGTLEDKMLERAINMIGDALVGLKRQGEKVEWQGRIG